MMMKLAARYQAIADPTVLELLKLTEKENIISFAGGTPSPQTFATGLVQEALVNIDLNLQYSPTAGTTKLRQVAAEWLSNKWQTSITPENIMITTGSQQALDIVGRMYLDARDTILLEDPTYFVALYAFNAYSPNYETIDLHGEGQLEKNRIKPKLLYIVPTFQNPTGMTLSEQTRKQLATFANEQEIIIIEDDPYSELYFDKKPPAPIYTQSPNNTIYMTSLSKIVGPALRIGIVVAEEKIIQRMTLVKQGMDLCTSGWFQAIATYVLAHKDFEHHLQQTRAYYANQSKTLQTALSSFMPDTISWTKPDGGLFSWLTGPESFNARDIYAQAIEKNVAYVPGYIFSPNQQLTNSLRLSYAHPTKEQIDEGIKILSNIIRDVC